MLTTDESNQTALESMIERFRAVLVQSPQNPTVLLGFAEANLRRGRRLEALQAYQKVLGLTPDVSDAHLAVAEIYLLHGLPLEAYEELRKVFEIEPGRPEAHLLLHEIEPLAPVPHALEYLRARFPTELQVAETRSRLTLEVEHLVREVEQLKETGEGPNSEPVAAYHLEQARKRLSRTQHLLSLLETLPLYSGEPEMPRPGAMHPGDTESYDAQPEMPDHSIGETGYETQELLEPSYETPVLESEPAYQVFEPVPELGQEPEPEFGQESEPELEPREDSESYEGSALEPEAAGESDIEDFFQSLALGGEPESDEVAESEPELVQESEPVATEPEPVLVEHTGPAGLSPERVSYYESIAPAMREAVDDLLRTRGLTSIFVVSSDGHVVAHQSRDSVTPEQMGELVLQIQSCLREFGNELAYWALECEGGIVLLQQLDERHGLVAVGQPGASFAMIRLNLDRARPRLAEPLASAPD